MYKILVVDDHESMRESLESMFSGSGQFQICGHLSDASLAVLYCEKLKPDLVFMDVCTANGASGLQAVEEIHKLYPQVKHVVMTAFEDITYIPQAREAGADGFVYKSQSLKDFYETAELVMKGEKVFPETPTIPVAPGASPLTSRELDVLRLMCRHKSTEEIAAELFLSTHTVKYHKRNMLAKTGFEKTIDLVFYMISNGWINPLF